MVGHTTIPAVVKTLTDDEADHVAAVENLQREDLDRYSEVDQKLKLVAQQFNLSPQAAIIELHRLRRNATEADAERIEQLNTLFKQLGRESWTSFVTNGLPVLNLDPILRTIVQSGSIEYAKVLLISRAPREHWDALVQAVQNERLTVEALRTRIAALSARPGPSDASQRLKRTLTPRALKQLEQHDPEKFKEAMDLIDRLERLLHTSPTVNKKRPQR